MNKELSYSEVLLIRQALQLIQSSPLATVGDKARAEKLGWELKDASAVVLQSE